MRFVATKDGDWVQFTLPAGYAGRFSVSVCYAHPADTAEFSVELGEADGNQRVRVGAIKPPATVTRQHGASHIFALIDVGSASTETRVQEAAPSVTG